MSKFDFITPFYNKQYNRESLVQGIDSVLATQSLSARAIPFSSDKPPAEWFPKIKGGSRHALLINENEGVQLFELTHSFKEGEEEKKESGLFFIYGHPKYEKVYVALTIEPSDFFRRALLPFIQGLYPTALMTFITHKKLRNLLEEFQEINQFTELIITRASQRLRFEEEGKHKKIMPVVSWPDMDLREAFNWVYQNNGWFNHCSSR